MSDQKISYFNTLIFTIVTGVVSLCILGLLFFDFGKSMIYFIIAFEIGVFCLIAYCIYKIVTGAKKENTRKASYVLRFNECPDYYTKRNIGGDVYCVSDYIVRDRNGEVYVSRVSPVLDRDGEPLYPPKNITINDNSTVGQQPFDKIKLSALEKDDKFPKNEDKCALIYNTPKDRDAKFDSYREYSVLPWTYMRSRCESFA